MPVALFDDQMAWPQPNSTPPPPRRRSISVGWVLLFVAAVLVLILGLTPSPYVIEQPGPAFNTLGFDRAVGSTAQGGQNGTDSKTHLISIPSQKTYPTSGSLDLLTVSLLGDPKNLPSWMEVVSAWFDPSKAVIPVDVAFPASSTAKQQQQENAVLMVDSQKDAIAAALNTLGTPFPQSVSVKQVLAHTPADGHVKVGDEIVSINGVKVAGIESLRAAVARNGAGATAAVGIVRSGQSKTVEVAPVKSGSATVLGVGVGMDYTFPFDVKIQLENVGGPSAGMMFALGIIDTLTPGFLNGSARVAGTGTIDNEGNVGPIGGIRQKLYGAKDAGAKYFLAPASNCDEVVGHVPGGLQVFAVKKLSDSLKVLKTIASDGDTGKLPRCTT